jgi:putative transposase
LFIHQEPDLTLEWAPARFGTRRSSPDQRSQFTTGVLADAGVRVSMDGRGRWLDNVFAERLWRSLKYEEVYLKGYADGRLQIPVAARD